MEKLYQKHKKQAAFLLVYIREAHPDSVLFSRFDPNGKEELKKIKQTDTVEERTKVAQICTSSLKLSTPTVIDRADNKVNAAYAGWPDRMYVVGVDGRIAYRGGPGPGGFRVNEVAAWLERNSVRSAQTPK